MKTFPGNHINYIEVSMIQCYVILIGARYLGYYLSISEYINGIQEYPQHVHGVVKEWKH
jgi:hypothetical protein